MPRRFAEIKLLPLFGLITLGSASSLQSQTIDFESNVYVLEKTIGELDGWSKPFDVNPISVENFTLQTNGFNKWVRCLNGANASISHNFPELPGTTELRWRWRASSDSSHFCLGTTGNSGSLKVGMRAAVCLEPNGTILTQGLTAVYSKTTWLRNTWYYMRLTMNSDANHFSVYLSTDSLQIGEEAVASKEVMNNLAAITKVVLRTEGGHGYVDVDDIVWTGVNTWVGLMDTAWSTGNNWSTGQAPDINTHVIFDEPSGKVCFLDKVAAIKSITFHPKWAGKFTIGNTFLDVTGNVDLTGGFFAESALGFIRLSGSRAQSLSGPNLNRSAPSVRHAGDGLVRLDTRPFFGTNLVQLQGRWDFNGFNISLTGDLTIKNGQPGTLVNLDGRAIVVGRSARLEGTSKDTLLGLASSSSNGTAVKGWTISTNDSLLTRFATIANSQVKSAMTGYAFQSTNAGGNSNWIFPAPPTILTAPKDVTLKTGDNALFKISVYSNLPTTISWLRNDIPVTGAVDSSYTFPGVRLADNNVYFSCKVFNAAGSTTSQAAKLRVTYPAPTAQPGSQEFSDSLDVTLSPSVAGSKIYFSQNGSPFVENNKTITLKDSTTLIAYSVFATDTSASAKWDYSKLQLPLLETPIISPDPISFLDSLQISLTLPSSPSASPIYYTLDQSEPDSTKNLYVKPFTITASTVVGAKTIKTGFRSSATQTQIYVRKNSNDVKLSPPTATPAGGNFADSVLITLVKPVSAATASIYYSVLGTSFKKYPGPFYLKSTSLLKIMAIQGTAFSDTVNYAFTKKLEAPTVNPKGRTFSDTLSISLIPKSQGASIYYSLNGKDPVGSNSTLYPGSPIKIENTAVLKYFSALGGDSSVINSESYFLVADSPLPSYHSGDYSSKIQIELKTSTKHALIYYTLDGSTPGPENGRQPYTSAISLDTSATLKAVAITTYNSTVTRSALLIENYNFILPGKRTLNPGQQLELSTNYSLTSPSTGASPVIVDLINVDSLRALKGFRDIQFAIKLSLPTGSTTFPPVIFKAPTGEARSLYSLGSQYSVTFITETNSQTLQTPGTYFLALDTLPPKITLSGESFTPQDSTRVVFTIQDNVSNLVLDLERTDLPAQNINNQPIGNPEIVTVYCRNPPGSIKPLTLKVHVSDHHQKSSFPSDLNAYHFLAQKNSGTVRTPELFKIGNSTDNGWDLITLPIATRPPITLAQIRVNNSEPKLEAVMWDQKLKGNIGEYKFLKETDTLTPGTAFWLSAPNSIASFTFPALTTVPRQETGNFHLTMHPGWNQVANPTLAPLYWPVTRTLPDVYDASLIKGLHGYDALKQSYVLTDTLLPWRGYFAYYKGLRDTVVQLSFQPITIPTSPNLLVATSDPSRIALAKNSAANGISIIFKLENNPALRIGASLKASNTIGIEDESQPPQKNNIKPGIWAQRLGATLETDMVYYSQGKVLSWNIILTTNERSPVSMGDFILPDGYSVWAVSRSRGVKFPLQSGGALPYTSITRDSLEIFAGPAADLALRLAEIPTSAGAFRFTVVPSSIGIFSFKFALPTAAQIHWALYSMDGKLMARENMHLPEGIYNRTPTNLSTKLAPGVYIFKLDWKLENAPLEVKQNGNMSQKITIH